MQTIEVVAKRGTDPDVSVSYDIAETLAELSEQFGEDIVFNHGKRSIVIALQGFMRSMMDQGKEAGNPSQRLATPS